MTESGTSFEALEAQMDEMDSAGVPDDWQKAFSKLRSELKTKREKFGPLEAAFAGLGENDRKGFIELATTLQADPEKAARMFVGASQSIAEAIEADWAEIAGVTPPAEQTPAEEETPVEKSVEEQIEERIQAALAERDRKAKEDAEIARIQAKLKELGHTDPSSPAAQLVLLRAKQIENADDVLDALQQAHDGLSEFILEQSKTLVSQDPADAGAEPPSDEGSLAEETPPATDGQVPELSDMKAAMSERLGALYDNSSLGDPAV